MTMNKVLQDERISRLLNCFTKYGFDANTDWPDIFLSTERKSFRHFSQERGDDKITIDKLFGEYIPDKKIIIVYYLTIQEFAMHYRKDFEQLFTIVLIHEYAHWITHRLPYRGNHRWRIDKYTSANESIHEGYAQLLTYWAIMDQDRLLRAFEELNDHQPEVYSLYKHFTTCHPELMLKSLVALRKCHNATWHSLEPYWLKIVKYPRYLELTRGVHNAIEIIFTNPKDQLVGIPNFHLGITTSKNAVDIFIDDDERKIEISSCFE